MAVSLGPSCPCWRRPAASPPLKLWRGAGAAQEPPWLKADSPSLPVDGATLLTACCPGSPRSCGRRQRPARADHGFDRCTLVVSVQRLLGHTIDNVTLCHHHQAPSSYCVTGHRTPQQLSVRTPSGHEPWAKILCHRIYPQRPEPSAFRISLFPLPPAASSMSTHVYVNSSNHAVATAGCVLPPMYLGPHSGHCVVRPEYNGFG